MRLGILFGSLIILAGCSKSDRGTRTATADSAMTAGENPAAESPTVSLADFAGKWKTRATDETGVIRGEAVLLATADTSGWTLTFPNHKPLAMRVIAVAGDSVITEVGPYESFLKKGAQIKSRAVNRIKDGKWVATLESHYTVAGRDSVGHLRVEGTRLQ
jgi:hypothetical protein